MMDMWVMARKSDILLLVLVPSMYLSVDLSVCRMARDCLVNVWSSLEVSFGCFAGCTFARKFANSLLAFFLRQSGEVVHASLVFESILCD